MDPNHAVFDQLPDESTIERIFAKCPPKQNSQRKTNQSRRAAAVAASSSSSSSAAAAAAAAASSSSSSVVASKETSKRQTRSRRQHRSRREVEGRRSKGRSAFKDNGGDTSDSSGANVASGKKYDYSLVDPAPRLNNNNNTNNNNSIATRRESERYVIHKSQSNHEDISRSQLGGGGGGGGSRMRTEAIHGPRMVHYGHNARDRRAAPVSRYSEIVKSASSHAFGNHEPNHTKVQGPSAKQDGLEQLSPLSSGRPRDGIVRLVGSKCARDLMDDDNNNNNNNNNTTSEAADNHDLNNLEFFSNSNTKLSNNDLDKPSSELELVKDISTTSSRQDEFLAVENNAKLADHNSRPVDGGNSHASGQRESAASLESAAIRQRQLQQHPTHLTSPTADLEFRHNIVVVDGAKKDLSSKSASDLIYINRRPDSTLQASPPDDSKVIIRRRHDSLDNNNNNSNNSETPTNIDSAATRDANKYINLLIYDSPAHETEGNILADKSTSTRIDLPRSSVGPETGSFRSPESSNLNSGIVGGLDEVAEEEDRLNKEEFELNSTSVSDLGASHKQQRLRSSPKAASHRDDEPAENFIESWKSESQPDYNIISVHHQASQQLLTTTDLSENDPNIIRNDTSSEELCSSNAATDLNSTDVDDATIKRAPNSPHFTDSSLTAAAPARAPSHQKNHSSGPDTASSRFVQQTRHSPVAAIGGSLQTVDESPEVGEDTQQPDHRTSGKGVICNEEQPDEAMSTGQPNLARRSITPPGFPQRIRPNQKTSQGTAREVLQPDAVGLDSKVKTEPQPASGLDLGQQQQPSTPIPEIIARPGRLEGQRVKFNDENLVSVRDDSIQPPPDSGQKAADKGAGGSSSHLQSARREHSPLMPIIKEAQNETEFEAQNFRAVDQREQELTTSLSKKLSLSSQSSGEVPPAAAAAAAASDDLDPLATTLERDSARTTSNDQPQAPDQSNATGISGDVTDSSRLRETDSASQQTNLRHHRLPNESSHYSIVRANRDPGTNNSASLGAEQQQQQQQLNNPAPRYSSIQFNSLSDAESEPEDSLSATVGSNLRKGGAPNSAGPRSYVTVQRYEQPGQSVIQQQQQQQLCENRTLSAQGQVNEAARAADSDAPIASSQIKQAMVFPRLDDGLSSEPESCDDEVEDDDERAMDADIDADEDDEEDEEDEDGVDDDVEDTLNSLDRRAIQTNMDNLLRQQQQQRQQQPQQQQQQRKNTTGRGHSQHHVTPLYNLPVGDHPSGLNQMKAGPGSAASYYPSSGQQQQDHTSDHHADLIKGSQNYSGQNGQSSSYWMGPAAAGAPSNHSTGLSPSSQQNSFNNQRSAVANNANSFSNSGSSLNNSNNKDEVLIEGVLFNVKYLGSTHSECEGRSEKEDRILQAEMAVKEVKFRNGESQSAVEVQLFISTEKIMVLDDKHRKIMMDHSLRTISYIADIGDAIVLIVRKKSSGSDATNELGRPVPKISCHVFESSESHTITKSISQAFQVAYAELVKANGTGDSANYMPRELDYQEVLNSQEMSTDEIEMFARKENQREVIVPKNENEILGISIVESGWGSVLPTVVIASLKHDGPAYRCKKLSIGDQILSVNGISLVGLPLAECQEILRKTKSQRVARLSVVPCPITVEVKIKRPDTKYQLGFSVQNGVICSLLRGGIAERGGVRVGHRIMSINGTTVVGVPHEKIVTLLASSVGEIRMKTCLTSLYRHMLGEENPVHI